MNFARDVVETAIPERLALVMNGVFNVKCELSFAEIAHKSACLAGYLLTRGVRRGETVMTVLGNRPEWVMAMVACFRLGAVALPCTEQLRASDLRARMDAVEPRAVVADARNADTVAQAGFTGELVTVPEGIDARAAFDRPIRHGQRYLAGQAVQAEHWLDARADDLCWCTGAPGWSKSVRNSFVAPWIRGATALLHDARFDAAERLEVVEREGVDVLCMAPTEYRAIAKRSGLHRLGLRHAVAAGEPLNPEIVSEWLEGAGVAVHDGYGQTETGALTGMPIGPPPRPGSMGRALPGLTLWVEDGELCADPATVPTFFLDGPRDRPWRTGDRVSQDADAYLWFEGRADDVIISAGYRIGPFEVESALLYHPAVAEAAAVGAPDEVRGQVVRAVVVLRDGSRARDALVGELQEHVKQQTAPYKYPRQVEFAEALPKTASGKIKRAELRRG